MSDYKTETGLFLLGDCMERMKEIPDKSIDLILCDLPYGTTACKWDQVIPFEPLWAEYWRVAKPSAAVVLTASQPFTSALVMSQIKAFKYEWIWEKNIGSNFAQTKYQPMKEHENICVFGRGRTIYNPVMEERTAKSLKNIGRVLNSDPSKDHTPNLPKITRQPISPMRVPRSVQRFDFNRRQGWFHPTQKPVALFEYLIRTYTDEGMTVLDNCAGSGTTAIAAERSRRKWACIERDPAYYAKAVERVQDERQSLFHP